MVMMPDRPAEVPWNALGCTQREERLFRSFCRKNPPAALTDGLPEADSVRMLGRVIRLDRGFPLVLTDSGAFRAEHAVALIKSTDSLSCVGDWVILDRPRGHDMAIIESVLPRREVFSRKDPSARTGAQVLASNIDTVFVLHALSSENMNARRLEREMVVAHESGATPIVVLTKADLASTPEALSADVLLAQGCAAGARVIVESTADGRGIDEIRSLIPAGTTAVLLGASGVGKSSLVNALLGEERQQTGAVREEDQRGRHTTVSREMVALPGGGVIIDTPGIRSVALWDSDTGVAGTFPEIEAAARGCRFSDCTHTDEPGCAVIAAVAEGRIEQRRLDSYRDLMAEMVEVGQRREVRERMDRHLADRCSTKGLHRHLNTSGRDSSGGCRRKSGYKGGDADGYFSDDTEDDEADGYPGGSDDDGSDDYPDGSDGYPDGSDETDGLQG